MRDLIEVNEALKKLKTNGSKHIGYLLYHQQLLPIKDKVFLTKAQFKECQEKDSGVMGRKDGQQG